MLKAQYNNCYKNRRRQNTAMLQMRRLVWTKQITKTYALGPSGGFIRSGVGVGGSVEPSDSKFHFHGNFGEIW